MILVPFISVTLKQTLVSFLANYPTHVYLVVSALLGIHLFRGVFKTFYKPFWKKFAYPCNISLAVFKLQSTCGMATVFRD